MFGRHCGEKRLVCDLEEVFDTSLNRMKEMVGDENYSGCANQTTDLTTIAVHFDYESGLLISEVLDSVFEQVNVTIQSRAVGSSQLDKIKEQLNLQLDEVLKSYKKNDKNELFNALMKIRSAATRFFYHGFECPKRPGAPDADG